MSFPCRIRPSALALLRDEHQVRDATLFGQTIHILVPESWPVTELVGRLETQQQPVEWREIGATLEDVFVLLTRSADEVHPDPLQVTEASRSDSDRARGKSDRNVRRAGPIAPVPQAAKADSPPVPSAGQFDRFRRSSWAGLRAVMTKEFVHIRRQPSTLFFMLVVPAMQTIIFGCAIDTQIEHIPLVVFDLDGRAMRALVEAFVNTGRFQVVGRVHDEESFQPRMTSGRAKVGLRIPPYYRISRSWRTGQRAGADRRKRLSGCHHGLEYGHTAGVSTLDRLPPTAAKHHSAPARDATGELGLPIEIRPRLLYNPDLESAFFVPGLMGIILQLVTLFLTSFAVVRERELGTLEQLFVTPVGRTGLLLGKLLPYAFVGFVEMLIVFMVMVYVFGVPIQRQHRLCC